MTDQPIHGFTDSLINQPTFCPAGETLLRARPPFSIQSLQAIAFDLDDTLYAERDYVRSGYRAVGDHLRRAQGTAEPYEEHLWRSFVAGRGAWAFQELSERFALGLSQGGVAALVKVYREHRPEIQPFPWVRPLLERLRTRYRLGLLSDGYLPAQRFKWEALGLAHFFDAVVWTEELGREAWKPSQIGFLQLARELGLGKRAHRRPPIAYVADNPAKDFVAPNELGWVTIQYTPPAAIHAGAAAPPGGEPQIQTASAEELRVLLLPEEPGR
jgi:putative hydrolase of the HAD superfamily